TMPGGVLNSEWNAILQSLRVGPFVQVKMADFVAPSEGADLDIHASHEPVVVKGGHSVACRLLLDVYHDPCDGLFWARALAQVSRHVHQPMIAIGKCIFGSRSCALIVCDHSQLLAR